MKKMKVILIILICLLLLPLNVLAISYAKIGADGDFNGDINIPSGCKYYINGVALAVGDITGAAATTGKLSQFAATTSLELAGVISDETGSGALVFGTSPIITGNLTVGNTTSNDSLLTVYSVDNGSYTRGLLMIDKVAQYGSWQNPSGLDGITTDVNGVPNGWGNLYFNWHSAGKIDFNNGGGNSIFRQKVHIGSGTTPTALLHLSAGTTTANTAPLKFTSGTLLTTPEAGAVEFLTDTFYGTITTSAVRKQFAFRADKLSAFAATTSSELKDVISDETGTDKLVYNTSPTLVTPILGTPTSGTLTSCTGLPIATGVSGLGAGVATFLATPSSANLAAAVTDETGNNKLVFSDSPTLVTPTLGAASATSINLTGGQIAFPAAQNASAEANTLDDYEEGTWTMGVTFGGGTTGITYGTNTGYYTKIGNIVTISGNLTLTNKGSSTGVAYLTGLPFALVNNAAAIPAVTLYTYNVVFVGQFGGWIEPNDNKVLLSFTQETGVRDNIDNADFANNSTILVNCTYRCQ